MAAAKRAIKKATGRGRGQPRWPDGTPVAPSGKGPGGGRWRDDGKPNKPSKPNPFGTGRISSPGDDKPLIAPPRKRASERIQEPGEDRPLIAPPAPRKRSEQPSRTDAPIRPMKVAAKKAAPKKATLAKAAPAKAAPAKRAPAKKAAPRRGGDAAARAQSERIERVASALHGDWRDTYRRQHEERVARGEAEGDPTRVKKTKDQDWIAAHGTDEVDIYSTPFDELPEDWQRENRDAAGVVEGILSRGRGELPDLSDEEVRQTLGEEIHQAWLGRENNSYALGGELDVPFRDLPRIEQDKDTRQLEIAMGALTPAPRKRAPAKKAAPAKAAPSRAETRRQIASEAQRTLDEGPGPRTMTTIGDEREISERAGQARLQAMRDQGMSDVDIFRQTGGAPNMQILETLIRDHWDEPDVREYLQRRGWTEQRRQDALKADARFREGTPSAGRGASPDWADQVAARMRGATGAPRRIETAADLEGALIGMRSTGSGARDEVVAQLTPQLQHLDDAALRRMRTEIGSSGSLYRRAMLRAINAILAGRRGG